MYLCVIVGMFLIVLILYLENRVTSQELLAKNHPCKNEIMSAAKSSACFTFHVLMIYWLT